MHSFEPNQGEDTALVLSGSGGIDWDKQPLSLTTREAAILLGKSPGNVRARASKGDFGPTTTGPDGLPRYDRERVRSVGERMAARQAQARPAPAPPPDPASASLMVTRQAQQSEQIALYKFLAEEARETARLANEEAKELREMMREREETTRETLSHMDMLYHENIAQMKEFLASERAQWQREAAAKNAEIERLKAQPQAAPEKGWGQLRRR